MDFTNNKWSLPHSPSFSDTTANEIYPAFSEGGDTLYFCSDRKINASSTNTTTLWYVTKTTDGWSRAKVLDTTSFKKDIHGQYLFFGRNTGDGFDIYWIDAGIIDELKTSGKSW